MSSRAGPVEAPHLSCLTSGDPSASAFLSSAAQSRRLSFFSAFTAYSANDLPIDRLSRSFRDRHGHFSMNLRLHRRHRYCRCLAILLDSLPRRDHLYNHRLPWSCLGFHPSRRTCHWRSSRTDGKVSRAREGSMFRRPWPGLRGAQLRRRTIGPGFSCVTGLMGTTVAGGSGVTGATRATSAAGGMLAGRFIGCWRALELVQLTPEPEPHSAIGLAVRWRPPPKSNA